MLAGGLELTYRRIEEITGQEHIIKYIVNILEKDTPGHAYIFSGPDDIGKKTLALAFAAALLCPFGFRGDSCGSCNSCRMFENRSTPDFHVIQAENSSIGIDEIRNLKADMVKRPFYGKRKVYLLCNAESMTNQAQNGILKTFEEPLPYAVILMTTANYDSLLETVRSRAVKLELVRNSTVEIQRLLEGAAGVESADIEFIAAYSNGIAGKALKLAGSGSFKAAREKLFKMVFSLPAADINETLEYYSIFGDDRENTEEFLGVMESLYRDLLAARTGSGAKLINSDKKDIILDNMETFTTGKIMRNISAIMDTVVKLRTNAAHRMAIEAMLIKLQEEE